jgi:hypothetical protein
MSCVDSGTDRRRAVARLGLLGADALLSLIGPARAPLAGLAGRQRVHLAGLAGIRPRAFFAAAGGALVARRLVRHGPSSASGTT